MKTTEKTIIRNWYIKEYSFDTIAKESILPNVTFYDLFEALKRGEDFYNIVGHNTDTFIRENIFSELCSIKKMPYSEIYDIWLNA